MNWFSLLPCIWIKGKILSNIYSHQTLFFVARNQEDAMILTAEEGPVCYELEGLKLKCKDITGVYSLIQWQIIEIGQCYSKPVHLPSAIFNKSIRENIPLHNLCWSLEIAYLFTSTHFILAWHSDRKIFSCIEYLREQHRPISKEVYTYVHKIVSSRQLFYLKLRGHLKSITVLVYNVKPLYYYMKACCRSGNLIPAKWI